MNKILVFTLISCCLFSISCSNKKVYKDYSIKDLSKPISDTLNFDNTDRVIGVEILLVGEVKGKAILEIENGSGTFSRIVLNGKINQTYETEWYSPKIFFKYTPTSIIQGDSLRLRYRMY